MLCARRDRPTGRRRFGNYANPIEGEEHCAAEFSDFAAHAATTNERISRRAWRWIVARRSRALSLWKFDPQHEPTRRAAHLCPGRKAARDLKAGPVPCAGCSACCYYAGVPVDQKRDRSRLPHLLTERNHDGRIGASEARRWSLRSPGRAGLHDLRAPSIGLSQLRLPRLRSYGLSRALRSQSSNIRLGVCCARASPALATGCRALRPTALHEASAV
jgi:hypothetical protein